MSGKTHLNKSDLQLIASKLEIEDFHDMQKAELIDAIRTASSSYSEPSRKPSDETPSSRTSRASALNRVLATASLIISLFSVIYTRITPREDRLDSTTGGVAELSGWQSRADW
jgi:hypothetical protein